VHKRDAPKHKHATNMLRRVRQPYHLKEKNGVMHKVVGGNGLEPVYAVL
jgi:hypothetical protein